MFYLLNIVNIRWLNWIIAALAAAAEENIEVTTVVKEVQARLQVSQIYIFSHKIQIQIQTQKARLQVSQISITSLTKYKYKNLGSRSHKCLFCSLTKYKYKYKKVKSQPPGFTNIFFSHKIPTHRLSWAPGFISLFSLWQNTNPSFDRDSKRSKQLCPNSADLQGGWRQAAKDLQRRLRRLGSRSKWGSRRRWNQSPKCTSSLGGACKDFIRFSENKRFEPGSVKTLKKRKKNTESGFLKRRVDVQSGHETR